MYFQFKQKKKKVLSWSEKEFDSTSLFETFKSLFKRNEKKKKLDHDWLDDQRSVNACLSSINKVIQTSSFDVLRKIGCSLFDLFLLNTFLIKNCSK